MVKGLGYFVEDSGLFSREVLENPYPLFAELRQDRPIYRDEELDAWVVLRHEDVTAVLKDRRFSSDKPGVARAHFPQPELKPLFDFISLSMVNRDEPGHSRLRKLSGKAFQRTEVERYAPWIRHRVDALIDEGLAKGSMEFVSEFAIPLPIMVIGEIVGIPMKDRARIKGWCDDYSFVVNNMFANISLDRLHRGLDATMAFRAYLEEQVERLRRAPEDNLLSHLVLAEEEGERLTLDELLINSLLLLNAGNETTTALLSNGLLALLRNPAEMARLRRDPELVPTAVEEFLRYEPPVQFLGRIAMEDLAIHGQAIAKGDLVLAMIGAADRDPQRYEGPEDLDIGRQHNHHLAFGHGIHICLGLQLARLEARIAFARLLERLDFIELAVDEVRHQDNFNMRCPSRLPIRIAAAGGTA